VPDIVLYLVNASEDPANAGYVTPEMQILDWIGKPVLVLLNQTGQPRSRTLEEADEERWRTHLRGYGFVCKPLTLDAFARCWVQEFVLLRAVGDALPEEKRATFRRLEAAWQSRRIRRNSMRRWRLLPNSLHAWPVPAKNRTKAARARHCATSPKRLASGPTTSRMRMIGRCSDWRNASTTIYVPRPIR
jgi:hypothetical protein